ncbi:hypothetical protein [Alloscardovia omnicolens]
MIPCPVCQTRKPSKDNPYVCDDCLTNYRTACLFIASHINDLYDVATRKASVTRSSSWGSRSRDLQVIPIRIKAWETYATISAHADAVAAWNHINFPHDMTCNAKLLILRNSNIFKSTTYAIDMRGFILAAKEMQQLLTPREDRTYIGACTACHTNLWAAPDAETITCSKCGLDHKTADIKAHTLKTLYNSTYTATISELVVWLKAWGIKVSKRTIQRWCKEGKLHAQTLDERGTKQFTIGDVLKQIKMARHF